MATDADSPVPRAHGLLSVGGIARTYIQVQRWRRGVPVQLRPPITVSKDPTAKDEESASGLALHACYPDAVFFASTTVVIYGLWGWLAAHWWPRSRNTWHACVADAMVFASHVIFMDLVVNWLTALLLHRVRCLERYQHRWEHRLTKTARLSSLLLISTMYASYTLCWMVAWGMIISCTSLSTEGCLHWNSTMWAASWGYALLGLLLRLTLWSMQHCPRLYTVSLLRKLSRFYWVHFSFKEWTGGVVFGAVTPFYDVVFGTCPFDIRWSVPIPFVDFLVCEERVFCHRKDPKAFRWSRWQWMWHLTWAAFIALLLGLLIVGHAIGWYVDEKSSQ